MPDEDGSAALASSVPTRAVDSQGPARHRRKGLIIRYDYISGTCAGRYTCMCTHTHRHTHTNLIQYIRKFHEGQDTCLFLFTILSPMPYT